MFKYTIIPYVPIHSKIKFKLKRYNLRQMFGPSQIRRWWNCCLIKLIRWNGVLLAQLGAEGSVKKPDAPTKPKAPVPLLKDAGKPGNPYALLNDIFPPEERIRTPAQEEENRLKLASADLGGLDADEVYVADNDLFVVRGFQFKKPYVSDPLDAGPPISDYVAPAPNPPPAPEPGTVFYPTNQSLDIPPESLSPEQFPEFFPDFNGTDPGQFLVSFTIVVAK